MQVLDLRRDRPPPRAELEVWASSAAELTAMLAVLEQRDDSSFDIGAERIEQLRRALPAEVRERLESSNEHLWKATSRLVGLLEEPGDVDQLFALLRERPETAWRTLLEDSIDEAADGAEALDAHIAGETDAEELVAALVPHGWRAGLVAEVARIAPSSFGDWLLAMLRPAYEAWRDRQLAEAMGPITREVRARRHQLATGTDVNTVLLEATNGYELGADKPIERILLTPSYWFRPWLLIGSCSHTETITSPVADEHLALPSQAPPPGLVKLCKALGDDGRLRLLRRMAGGPIQLADAMEELDVAKTTAHHHLAILRQAGLVLVRGEGRGTTYGLRGDPAHTTFEMLAEYVGPNPTHAARRAPR